MASTSSTPLPLTTDRLTLRTFTHDDLDATLAYYGDPEVARYLPFAPWTAETAVENLAKRVRRTSFDSGDHGLALVVETEGRQIGDVVLFPADDTRSRGEIGWVFHPDAAGHGYATEAARAVLGLAFETYRLHRVLAQLDARNDASARLCERLGMTREAHLREDWFDDGFWTDTLVYGMLAREWPPTA